MAKKVMKDKDKVLRKLKGWSIRGRPFSPKEYIRSYLKKNTKKSYADYLQAYSKQYKNPKLRRSL